MKTAPRNSSLRQGKFQWMDEDSKQKYIEELKKKISDGYFYSERVIGKLVEELAPVFSDSVEISQ
ncbi:MAG: hypothetical protein JW795_21520 [Chitinivibrionales bacterium]|nr:hypothetical protein [Chitinivibrionales bacterium]